MNDRYQILSTVAIGGSGSIQQAWDKSQNRDVAIKRQNAEGAQKDALVREARALYALRHPHIVTIHEYGSDEQGAYLVMEMIKGESLAQRLSKGPLNLPDFKILVAQTLDAITSAHEAGLIHRDLKPENIMIPWDQHGQFQIKVIDFGLSQQLPAQGGQQDSMMGSIHFMAPEQFGSGHVDVRTDLYALGCIYYYALTGYLPFPGDQKHQVITAHLYPPKYPLGELRPDLSDELCAWVNQFMSVQPAWRPATAAMAMTAFRQLGSNLQAQAAAGIVESDVMVLEEEEVPAVVLAEEEEEAATLLSADDEEEPPALLAVDEEEQVADDAQPTLEEEEEVPATYYASEEAVEIPIQTEETPEELTAAESEEESAPAAWEEESASDEEAPAQEAEQPAAESEPEPAYEEPESEPQAPAFSRPAPLPVPVTQQMPSLRSTNFAPNLAAEKEPEIPHQGHHLPVQSHTHSNVKAPMNLPLIIGCFVGVMALQFGVVAYFKQFGQEGRDQRFAELMEQEHPQGSDLDVRIVLDFLDVTASREKASQLLLKITGGNYIDELLLDRLKRRRDTSAAAPLITLLGQRRSGDAFETVLSFTEDGRQEVRKATWAALGRITTADNLPKLLAAAQRTQKLDHPMVTKSLISAIETAQDRPLATNHALKAYQQNVSKPDSKALLFNVLARVGGEGTVDLVKEAISDPAQKVRLAAITELADYPTHEPLQTITDRFAQEEDEGSRLYLLLAARELVSKPGPYSQQILFNQAEKLYAQAKDSEEKTYVLNVLTRIVSPQTAEFFENFSDPNDPQMTSEAREMAEAFRQRLTQVTAITPDGKATPVLADKADYRPKGTLELQEGALVNWTQDDDWASWLVELPRNGTYEIAVYQAHDSENLGTYEVLLAGQDLLTAVVQTQDEKFAEPKKENKESQDKENVDEIKYKGFIAGTIEVKQPGIYRLRVRAKTVPAEEELFRLQRLAVKAL